MTRKDYQMVAQAVKDQRVSTYGMFPGVERTVALATLDNLTERLSGAFAINPNFREDIFLKACGAR